MNLVKIKHYFTSQRLQSLLLAILAVIMSTTTLRILGVTYYNKPTQDSYYQSVTYIEDLASHYGYGDEKSLSTLGERLKLEDSEGKIYQYSKYLKDIEITDEEFQHYKESLDIIEKYDNYTTNLGMIIVLGIVLPIIFIVIL